MDIKKSYSIDDLDPSFSTHATACQAMYGLGGREALLGNPEIWISIEILVILTFYISV
jgi:hypothetical protein